MIVVKKKKKKKNFLLKVGYLLPAHLRQATQLYPLNIVVLFITGESDVSEDGDGDEEIKEEHEDADEALAEEAEGEAKEAAVEEFVDKKHESQFCLETNFLEGGGQEDTESTAEPKDSKGKKKKFSSK